MPNLPRHWAPIVLALAVQHSELSGWDPACNATPGCEVCNNLVMNEYRSMDEWIDGWIDRWMDR